MPRTNRLTDTSIFQFKDIDLSGALLGWDERLLQRVASHVYLKRDGGEQENMGAAPGEFTFRCVFMGEGWARRYRELVSSHRREPRGDLIHPIFGRLPVICLGIQNATVTPAQSLDTIEFSIAFREDAVDNTLTNEEIVGAATRASQADTFATAFSEAAAGYTDAATVTAVAVVASTVTAFSAAALESITDLVPDPSLPAQLADVDVAADAARDAIFADSHSTSDASAWAAVILAEQAADACALLLEAVTAEQPVIVSYTVPALTSLSKLAVEFYGTQGRDQIDRLRTINPTLVNPAAIAAGTVLQVIAPTV